MRELPLLILLSSIFFVACSSAEKTESVNRPVATETLPEKQTLPQDNRNQLNNPPIQADFAEGWVSDDRVQALYSTTADNLKEETDIMLARERLAWLMLLERYDLRREDRVIATRLAGANLFQQLGTEKVEKQTKGDRVIILLSKSKPGLRSDWEAALVTIENRFPELKNRRKNN